VNFARRQQYRRLLRAGTATAGCAAAAAGLVAAGAGAATLSGLLLLAAVGLGLYARHWRAVAGRSRVGARSEDEVRRALAGLEAEGWRLRHSLPRSPDRAHELTRLPRTDVLGARAEGLGTRVPALRDEDEMFDDQKSEDTR
jgi:hypothetical protein